MSLVTLLAEVDRRFAVLHDIPEGEFTDDQGKEMSFLIEASVVLRGQSSEINTLAKRLGDLADAVEGGDAEAIKRAVQFARHALRPNGPMSLHQPPVNVEEK